MARKTLSLLAILFLSVVMNSMPAAANDRETTTVHIIKKWMPSVVSINKREDGGKLEVFGAGCVIDERGYVLTNEHVIHGWEQIAVGFNDHTYLPAEVVWQSAESDLVVLKVLGKHAFQAVKLGPSDLKLGEPLIAIGSPAGIEWVVTKGIVSKIDTLYFSGKVFKKSVQMDAAINGGSSGGPVFNANGEVVGIAAVKFLGNEGISWAINADIAMVRLAVACSASKIAGVEHGLTVEHKIVGPEGDDRRLVLVRRVSGPASKAGLKRGDRIIKVTTEEGTARTEHLIHSRFDLERAFWSSQPGDKVILTIERNYKRMLVVLTLEGPGIEPDEE